MVNRTKPRWHARGCVGYSSSL